MCLEESTMDCVSCVRKECNRLVAMDGDERCGDATGAGFRDMAGRIEIVDPVEFYVSGTNKRQ